MGTIWRFCFSALRRRHDGYQPTINLQGSNTPYLFINPCWIWLTLFTWQSWHLLHVPTGEGNSVPNIFWLFFDRGQLWDQNENAHLVWPQAINLEIGTLSASLKNSAHPRAQKFCEVFQEKFVRKKSCKNSPIFRKTLWMYWKIIK